MDELTGALERSRFSGVRVNFRASYIDVNREPYELDPRMLRGTRFDDQTELRQHALDAGGGGSAPLRAWSATARRFYRERLSVDDGLARIEALYKPYTARCGGL